MHVGDVWSLFSLDLIQLDHPTMRSSLIVWRLWLTRQTCDECTFKSDLRAPPLILKTCIESLALKKLHNARISFYCSFNFSYFASCRWTPWEVKSELWSNVCKSLTCCAWAFHPVLYPTHVCVQLILTAQWLVTVHFCKNTNDSIWK